MQTPMKHLENKPINITNLSQGKLNYDHDHNPLLQLPQNKQNKSNIMKIEYLQNKLKMKMARLDLLQQRNTQLNEKNIRLQNNMKMKQSIIIGKNKEIDDRDTIIIQKDRQIQKLIHDLKKINQQRVNDKNDIIKYKQKENRLNFIEYQDLQRLNKVLTRQNGQLIADKKQLKRIVAEYDSTLHEVHQSIDQYQETNNILEQMNKQLKIEIENLIFQLKMVNRRQDNIRLMQYEDKIHDRLIDIDMQQVRGYDREYDYERNEEQSELIELLKQRIENLQLQLNKSQKRCKQLQNIIINQ